MTESSNHLEQAINLLSKGLVAYNFTSDGRCLYHDADEALKELIKLRDSKK